MTGVWLVSYIALWILFLVMATILLMMLRNPGIFFNSVVVSPQKHSHKLSSKVVPGKILPELTIQTLAGDHIQISTFHGMKTTFFVVSPHSPIAVNLLQEIYENGT